MAPPEPALRRAAIRAVLQKAIGETEIADVSTRLREPAIAEHRLAGIDDLLKDPRLVAEALRTLDLPARRFWHLSTERRSELVWRHLFVERTPLSEAARDVLLTLRGLGLEPAKDELPKLRRWFAEKRPDWLVDKILGAARIGSVVVTSSPFEAAERRRWEKGFTRDARFRISFSLDTLLHEWPRAAAQLGELGYEVSLDFARDTEKQLQKFLEDWSRRLDPVYLESSLPSGFRFPHSGPAARLLERVVLPHCARINRPFAMRVGEVATMNPELEQAGLGVVAADLSACRRLVESFPTNRFLLVALAAGNQAEVTSLASVFPRLHPAGCGVLASGAEVVGHALGERLATSGASFTAMVSNARVFDQLISRWERSRRILVTTLEERYGELVDMGWPITQGQIERDSRALLGGAFETFAGL